MSRWVIEGHGVDSDIAVEDDPSHMQDGADPQLDRASAEVLKSLETNPPRAAKPLDPNRAGGR